MKRIFLFSLGLLLVNAYGESVRFSNLDQTGTLTWTNRSTNAQYRIETVPDLDSEWSTNTFYSIHSATTFSANPDSKIYYRVVWTNPPPVHLTHFNINSPYSTSVPFDINEDGNGDFSLNSQILSNGEVSEQLLYASAHGLVISPLEYGALIGPSLDWQGGQQLFGRRTAMFGPFDGSWPIGTNAFLPIRIEVDAAIHYGWINIEEYQYYAGGPDELWAHNYRVIDAAVHRVPNQTILAGQTE